MEKKQVNTQSLFSRGNNVGFRISTDYSITYMDTVRVEEIKKDLLKYADLYFEKIINLFNRLKDVPNISGEWIGESAEQYFKVIAQDRNKLLSFGNNLRNIAIKLGNDVNLVSGNVSKLVRLESEAKYYDKI